MMAKVKRDSACIREVWAHNLDEEFKVIRKVVAQYSYVAMDTAFPGVVIKPNERFNYHTVRANVDNLKLIQLGLTFSDEKGNLPGCGTGRHCVWQFNLKEFNPNQDIHAPDSIKLLRQSGIDFTKNEKLDIPSNHFVELLLSSGIVLNENVKWDFFNGAYDFGYLLKLMICNKLIPYTQKGFLSLMRMYFPSVYDVKHMIRFCDGLYGVLNKVAELVLKVERIGACHQAGSDSLLTCSIFMKLKERGISQHIHGPLYKYLLWIGSGELQLLILDMEFVSTVHSNYKYDSSSLNYCLFVTLYFIFVHNPKQ